MKIWDTVRKQLRSVIEWETADHSALFELWSANGDEIKDASHLIIEPGQGAVFVYEGEIRAVLTEPGRYDVQTANIPFITTLQKFMQGFESEHKVGIYYFWRTEFLNQKWGTVTPIKYDDPVYEFPVGLRAFGNFSFKLEDAESFFVNIVGGQHRFLVDDLRLAVADRLQQPLTDLMAEAGYSYAQIDAHRDELGAALEQKLDSEFDKLGLAMTDFRIESTNFDEATVKRISRIADVTAEAKAAEQAGMDFASLQQLEALREAARNESGAAGAGVGIGAGIGLGQVLSENLARKGQAATPQANAQTSDPAARLGKLKSLLDEGLIDQDDFDARKEQILSEI